MRSTPPLPPVAPPTPTRLGEDWLIQLFEGASELVWIWEPTSAEVTWVNPAFEKFWGFGAAGLVGSVAFVTHFHAADREHILQCRAQLMSPRGKGYTEEYRVLLDPPANDPSASVRTVWLREQTYVLRDPRGKPARIAHIARDVTWQHDTVARGGTRREMAERALAESEAKYRAVVENVGEGIMVTAAGRIVYANASALALTGNDAETASTQPFINFIHADDRERVLENHRRRARGEETENHYQFRVLHKNGSVHWVEIGGVPFEWQNEPATLNFLTDVTERRQVEQDMRNALTRERELSELKSRFVAVASHEFRTPLASILSSAELLDTYGDRLPGSERQEILEQIKSAVARMTGMVEQVLLTSKLEAGEFEFAPVPQRLPDLLVQIAAEMDRAHPQADRIEMECEEGDEPRLIDPQLLRHILVNLLTNALKYSGPDSPVICAVRVEDDDVWLRVTDHGIGIPESDQPRLFARFHRGANVGNVQGTGIGLHVVKACVAKHDGTVEVHSRQGLGTTFHVKLRAPLA